MAYHLARWPTKCSVNLYKLLIVCLFVCFRNKRHHKLYNFLRLSEKTQTKTWLISCCCNWKTLTVASSLLAVSHKSQTVARQTCSALVYNISFQSKRQLNLFDKQWLSSRKECLVLYRWENTHSYLVLLGNVAAALDLYWYFEDVNSCYAVFLTKAKKL